MIPSLKLLFY